MGEINANGWGSRPCAERFVQNPIIRQNHFLRFCSTKTQLPTQPAFIPHPLFLILPLV